MKYNIASDLSFQVLQRRLAKGDMAPPTIQTDRHPERPSLFRPIPNDLVPVRPDTSLVIAAVERRRL